MKLIKNFKIDAGIVICILLLFIISLISINSAQYLIDDKSLVLKQALWYLLGFLIAFIIMIIGNKVIIKYSSIMYIIGIILLVLVLFFGADINNSKCWFKIPGIGNFQPSEFMKIILILVLSNQINKFRENNPVPSVKDEFIFLLKIGLIVLVPSVLTFLEPDTGVVLIYLLITFIMLLISGVRYRWFILVITILLVSVGIILGLYFFNNDLFINIFGSSFFLRIDRLLDWSNGSGYQLEQGITSIGSAGLLGFGLNKTPIYFPEPQTDFIFAVYANNFGFIGSIVLISILTIFDIKLIKLAIESEKNINKYIIAGIVGMLIYQQIQNIGMTIGLMPITGITLPFISYGGSSLLSYMIMIGIIFNISKENIIYRN